MRERWWEKSVSYLTLSMDADEDDAVREVARLRVMPPEWEAIVSATACCLGPLSARRVFLLLLGAVVGITTAEV